VENCRKRLRILTIAAIRRLIAYCQSYARWSAAEDAIAKMAENDAVTSAMLLRNKGAAQTNPLVKIAMNAARDMVRIGSEFDLTPSARVGVAAGGYTTATASSPACSCNSAADLSNAQRALRRHSGRASVRLIVLSAQMSTPDASIDSPSSNVPRRSKRQPLARGSLADACLPDFTGPTTFFQSAEPDAAASSWTRSALREFTTVTVTAALLFGAACAVRPNRVAPARAAASVRVIIKFIPSITTRRDFYAHHVNHLLKRIQVVSAGDAERTIKSPAEAG
jgi:hypothetical protein